MLRLLVVDDDTLTCALVSQALSQTYELITLNSGKAALELLAIENFDLIILDIMMPEMDGWEVIGHIRSDPRNTLTPVMFLTGATREEDRIRGFRLGADDYVAKPFVQEELRQRVKRALDRAAQIGRPDLDTDGNSGFKGSLSDFGLASLLTMLAMENKTGLLHLVWGNTYITLFLHQGQVVCAKDRARRNDTSYQTVFRALCLKKGTFYFATGDVDTEDEISQTTSQLLLEVAQQMDERRSGTHWDMDDEV